MSDAAPVGAVAGGAFCAVVAGDVLGRGVGVVWRCARFIPAVAIKAKSPVAIIASICFFIYLPPSRSSTGWLLTRCMYGVTKRIPKNFYHLKIGNYKRLCNDLGIFGKSCEQ